MLPEPRKENTTMLPEPSRENTTLLPEPRKENTTMLPDTHECQTGKALCDIHADCTDTPESYTCTCRDGYTGDGRSCTDIDECLVQTSCGTNADCNNTDGSYTCTCLNGYSEVGQTCAGINLMLSADRSVVKEGDRVELTCRANNADDLDTIIYFKRGSAGQQLSICQIQQQGSTCWTTHFQYNSGYNCSCGRQKIGVIIPTNITR
ncbi:signal peptide, CUB and EGF-like domain-containing protein 2 [Gigantopelta aegis]|uniref:signal peptide, CUB and EGF-like domain-containing protein 2 n=1 Tax=Gigantopelta aegis TaxID=1735272 RepID=UPI001B888EB1|nr:signal peptide, CUB and EGF-like domain-containing protein 2 [Gigantopelta aegis]